MNSFGLEFSSIIFNYNSKYLKFYISTKKNDDISFCISFKNLFNKTIASKKRENKSTYFRENFNEPFVKQDNEEIFIKSQKQLEHLERTIEVKSVVIDEANDLSKSSNHVSLTVTIDLENNTTDNKEYEKMSGEIYMRVGLAIFTICALISHIIHLIQLLEAFFNHKGDTFTCKATFFTTVIAKVSCVIFILVQSAFIIKYVNIVLHSTKIVSMMGFMHIMCTNFCLFVRTVIFEAIAEIRHELAHGSEYDYLKNDSFHNLHKRGVISSDSSKIQYEKFDSLGCINVSITDTSKKIQQMQNYLAEFLYPLVIEYSLFALTIFYLLWSKFKSHKSHNKIHKHSYDGLNQFAIDCTKSTTG